ncbi:MBL fold metallo-hydrolase [Paenibacillus sp. LMG 31456]|uniref:MBL fold metallo-hydrolase n=1 Tax=Paenibacillus foliorum TaxID=2654974 RepID=A0A972GW66_9BACL|nr:MBL fold metallo-hydrolase [Paenibacillus foliorum]NOU97250.1 MBL fold metallo-hydrolase [Paenibacillus foliorum]
MHIASGIEMLEISATVMGKPDVIHPTLIWDEDTAVLVDTGYPGQMLPIIEAMEKAGVPFGKLNKIIMTHQDLDHIGSLPAIIQESPNKIEVLANEVEQPYIQGEKRLVKITPEAIAKALQSLPPEVPEEWRKAFQSVLENPPKAGVDRTISDGEELPYCGGITVINTPGHTPGHLSLYHKSSKTLIAADALVIVDGELLGSQPQYTYDLNLAAMSIKKLTHYDIESIICYHGGLYKGNANQRIAELANE